MGKSCGMVILMTDEKITPELIEKALEKATKAQLIDALFDHADIVDLGDWLADKWQDPYGCIDSTWDPEEKAEKAVADLLELHNWDKACDMIEQQAISEMEDRKSAALQDRIFDGPPL